jgi:hypothetical protein
MCGVALELEACSGARGALKERKKQVTNEEREKQEMVMEEKSVLPFSNRPRLLRAGHADFLPLGFVGDICGLGPDSLLSADTCA